MDHIVNLDYILMDNALQ